MYLVATIFLCFGTLLALLSLGIVLLRCKPPSLIFDKYPCKGVFYHLKYGIALLLVKSLRKRLYQRNEEQLGASAQLATRDQPQPLTNDPKCYDMVSFLGANSKGQQLLISMERRRRGVVKLAMYVWLPDEGLYCLPKLPDMVHFVTDGQAESKDFCGEGFQIYPVDSMQRWRIKYAGQLRSCKRHELVPIELDLEFSAPSQAHFDYNRDLSSAVIADSIAHEAWNDSFYNLLQKIDQILAKRTHYEQQGELRGTLQLGGDGKRLELQLHSLRDHGFGTERCISSINRYVYFVLFLEDGTRLVMGNLSQPSFFLSSLKVGYVYTPVDGYQPITSCNFELYTYGEKGTPPQHQHFVVSTAKREYFVQLKAEECALRFAGGDWESKIYNQFATCTVNGIKGQGITEYLYRNKGGRPDSVSRNDPAWYQRIKKFERSLSNMEPVEGEEEDFFF